MQCDRWSPFGLAQEAPLVRPSCIYRTAVATPTPNRSAATRLDIPLSIATRTRERRSSKKVFAMPAGLLVQQAGSIRLPPRQGVSYDSEVASAFVVEFAYGGGLGGGGHRIGWLIRPVSCPDS